MTRHFVLVLALALLAGAVYPAKSMPSLEQQLNDEYASLDIEEAEALLKELEDLVDEEVMANDIGGDEEMALFPEKRYVPTQAGYKGCYVDTHARKLPGAGMQVSAQQSAARCVEHCRSKGFAYAGTQYSRECFCGTQQNFQNIGGRRPDSECNMACTGNAQEKCGGFWRMSVYAVLLYKGCYVDAHARKFPGAGMQRSNQQSAARCVELCKSKGFAYAGTQYSNECFCGTQQNFQNIGGRRPDSECNKVCTGNAQEKCGGTWRMSVYAVHSQATSPNIALGKPTRQCSTGWGGSPGRAVDGNRSPHWTHNSCTHTNEANDAWWYVDLGTPATIDHVTIVNRRDCCSERITPFDVHVGDSTNVASNPRCGGHHHFPPTETEHVVHCRGLRGRYVGIRLPGKRRVLTLCEVEVYAAPNLALGKPTSQSNVAYSGYAPRATDGCRDPNWGSQCCTHTPAENYPWLQVDLGRSVTVQWVVVMNRADCCRERLNGFNVHIGNSARVDLNPRCGGHHTVPAGKNKDAINCNGMAGRFVGIRLPGCGRVLTICEVEVYEGNAKKWRDDGRCGPGYTTADGSIAQCNPRGNVPCCSPYKWCGPTAAHCKCAGCVDYRKQGTRRTSEVRGTDGKDCGEHEEGDTWVSDEDGHNCVCDEDEELCYKVECGEDGKQQPIKGEDGMWTCPEPEETEEEAREFLDETMENGMDDYKE